MNDVVDFEDEILESGNNGLFDCEFSSIDIVINKIAIYTGVKDNVPTENGLRTLIAFELDGEKSAFFTDSKRLKEEVLKPNRKYPFRAIIKVIMFGNNSGFKFFSPKSPISQQDIDNFNYYQKTKRKNWRR